MGDAGAKHGRCGGGSGGSGGIQLHNGRAHGHTCTRACTFALRRTSLERPCLLEQKPAVQATMAAVKTPGPRTVASKPQARSAARPKEPMNTGRAHVVRRQQAG